jgi:uncharacterized protein YndB with AHSA1/START domain
VRQARDLADVLTWELSEDELEVVPPERVVQTFEFEGMPGAVSVESLSLEEHDGKTTLRVTSTYPLAEAVTAMLESGMEQGAAACKSTLRSLRNVD